MGKGIKWEPKRVNIIINRDVRAGRQRQEAAVLWIELRQRKCSPRMIRIAKQRIAFPVWPMHSKDGCRFQGKRINIEV